MMEKGRVCINLSFGGLWYWPPKIVIIIAKLHCDHHGHLIPIPSKKTDIDQRVGVPSKIIWKPWMDLNLIFWELRWGLNSPKNIVTESCTLEFRFNTSAWVQLAWGLPFSSPPSYLVSCSNRCIFYISPSRQQRNIAKQLNTPYPLFPPSPHFRYPCWYSLLQLALPLPSRSMDEDEKNTIKAGGSTARAQNVDWVSGWSGWYPLDCYDY